MSAFATSALAFEAFLRIAQSAPALAPGKGGDLRNQRFVPRNFQLDERVDAGRATVYTSALSPDFPTDLTAAFQQWHEAHNRYLKRHVFSKPPGTPDHHVVDTNDPAACPETFRFPLALKPFKETDLDTHLIRVVPVADLAYLSAASEDEIFALGQEVARNPGQPSTASDELAVILTEAYSGPRCDHRPIFAAFYEDFLTEFGSAADVIWPDRLRNRLGLYHINQWNGPLPRRVFLFRYAVRDIPRSLSDSALRPIAVPTVLDHRFSEAFCPAPRELTAGQLLHLQAGANSEPAREVLHLFTPMEPRHLHRVGAVTTSVPDYLGTARRDHLVWLRIMSSRDGYAAATDNDLLNP